MAIPAIPPVRNHQHLSAIESLPRDIFLSILDFLPPAHVRSCCSISHHFNTLASDPEIWKSLVGHYCSAYTVEWFSPLVDKRMMTWKEVWRYRSLSSFVSFFLQSYNRKSSHLSIVQHGICFSIKPIDFEIMGPNIEMEGQKEVFYQGKPETFLTNIVHDGTCIYAYRNDGILIQWNPLSGKSREIETLYSRKDPSIETYQNEIKRHGCLRLVAKDGIVVISYYKVPVFEIIDVEKNIDSLIEGAIDELGKESEAQIHNKKIYIIKRDHLLIHNLENQSDEPTITLPEVECSIEEINFAGNRIYARTEEETFRIINHGEQIHRCGSQFVEILEKSIAIGNFLLTKVCRFNRDGKVYNFRDGYASIFDCRTGLTQEVLLFENKQLLPEGFEEMVELCQTRNPFDFTENVFQGTWKEVRKTATLVRDWFDKLF